MVIEYLRANFVTPNADKLPPWTPVSTAEFFLRPFLQEWETFTFFIAFFFFCQHGSRWLMNKTSKKFRSFSEDDKDTWCVRFVACVNSLICGRTAYLFVTQALYLPDEYDMYQTVPGMQIQHIAIASYFAWDIWVCVTKQWGALYTGHGIASFLGTYCCCWPFAERWVGWFSGAFELSNIFVHGAEMLSMLDMSPSIVGASKGIFAVLFIISRPIGGTYIGYKYSVAALDIIVNKNYSRCHHFLAPWLCLAITWVLMSLQYLWTMTVLRGIGAALGLCEAEDLGDAKSPTSKKQKHDFPPEDVVDELKKQK